MLSMAIMHEWPWNPWHRPNESSMPGVSHELSGTSINKYSRSSSSLWWANATWRARWWSSFASICWQSCTRAGCGPWSVAWIYSCNKEAYLLANKIYFCLEDNMVLDSHRPKKPILLYRSYMQCVEKRWSFYGDDASIGVKLLTKITCTNHKMQWLMTVICSKQNQDYRRSPSLTGVARCHHPMFSETGFEKPLLPFKEITSLGILGQPIHIYNNTTSQSLQCLNPQNKRWANGSVQFISVDDEYGMCLHPW